MKIKYVFLLLVPLILMMSCGNSSEDSGSSSPAQEAEEVADPRGIGEVKNVTLNDPPEEDRISNGKAIYEMKCSACHKLTDQRVVGPGWAGVTNKRRPEWIMNMITNVEVMLAEDPQAQALLEECLTRMPNQGVSIGDARDILEFMRQNDLDQVGTKDQAVNN